MQEVIRQFASSIVKFAQVTKRLYPKESTEKSRVKTQRSRDETFANWSFINLEVKQWIACFYQFWY